VVLNSGLALDLTTVNGVFDEIKIIVNKMQVKQITGKMKLDFERALSSKLLSHHKLSWIFSDKNKLMLGDFFLVQPFTPEDTQIVVVHEQTQCGQRIPVAATDPVAAPKPNVAPDQPETGTHDVSSFRPS